jgi:broad specificity phosphatase PhoE
MARLLVVRHAQSVWNAAERWQGWSDAPLSELGEQQAREAGQVLATIGFAPGAVACSDLARARRTAELLAAAIGFTGSLVELPDLREQDLGEWIGLTSAEIEAHWPHALERRRAGAFEVPGGEEGAHFVERCMAALGRLARRVDGDALVVVHGGVIMAMEAALGAWEPGHRQPNVSGWWVESRGTSPDLELVPVEPVDLLTAVADPDGGGHDAAPTSSAPCPGALTALQSL